MKAFYVIIMQQGFDELFRFLKCRPFKMVNEKLFRRLLCYSPAIFVAIKYIRGRYLEKKFIVIRAVLCYMNFLYVTANISFYYKYKKPSFQKSSSCRLNTQKYRYITISVTDTIDYYLSISELYFLLNGP